MCASCSALAADDAASEKALQIVVFSACIVLASRGTGEIPLER